MKKIARTYVIIWCICLLLFNAIVFVTQTEFAEMNKFGGAFWVGYCFITIAFIGQLACAFKAFKAENATKLFYNLPLITISYSGLIATIIVGVLCMAIPNLPNWIGIIVCLLILAFTAIAVIKAVASVDIVSSVDEKVTVRTAFIKTLTVEAQCLVSTAKSKELQAEAQKVYDAIRYSDPMSNSALADIENQLLSQFSDFSMSLKNSDLELSKEIAKSLCDIACQRNALCKNYK